MSLSELPLIRTKLAPPKAGSAPVNREALLKLLQERQDRTLSTVVGPAGSGKTTLLIQWRKQLILRGAKVAWFNVGPDDDEAAFAAYLVESLSQAGLDIRRDALQNYIRAGGKSGKALLTSLTNDLDRYDEEIYLFVDDLHYISSFATLHLLDRLIAIAPATFHLVISSRTQPPIELARLRSEDQLTELDFNGLRFGLDETQRFADTQGLQKLSRSQIHLLHDMTDGWAAGLQLLAFSLRKNKAPEAFFEQQGTRLLSQGQALSDYLEKAAIEHLSEIELTFLTRISICRRFNRPLCESLTGDPDAAEHLAKFERENLFLIRIDTEDAEPWFRFHRLFATFLNKRFEKQPQNELQKLNELASRWFAGRNLHQEAMRHAALAGDTAFHVELIDRAARRMVSGANFIQLIQWCEAIPDEHLRHRLNLCLCLAWAQLSCNRVADFDHNIADILLQPSRITPDTRTEVQLLQAYRAMRKDDTATSLRIVEPMMRGKAPATTFQSLLLVTIASLSLVYANDFEQAREVARTRHRYAIPDRPENPKPFVDVVLGFSHLVQGDIRLALASLTPFMDQALRTVELGADAAGLFGGYLLEAYYQANDLARARQFLDRYSELIGAVGVGDGLLFTYRVRARLERLAGDKVAAQTSLLQLEEFGYRHQLDRLVAWSLYDQVNVAISDNQKSSLRDLLRRLDQLAERYASAEASVLREIALAALMAHADVACAHAEDRSRVATIEAAEAAATVSGRQLLCVRLGFMRALVMFAEGDKAEALELAGKMTLLAVEAGMSRVVADLGAMTGPLIDALLLADFGSAETEFLQSSRRTLHGAAPVSNLATTSTSVTSNAAGLLSAREQEVLEYLSKALSTKSIARALDLSAGTVKWHLKNIYGKLNAVSREDALTKARSLKILE